MTVLAPPPEGLVLVVDDDAGMRETILDVLEVHGMAAIGAGTGAEASALYAAREPAVLVIDHRLPDMTGLELCGTLKAQGSDVQVILLTGYATLENAIAAVGQADEFLIKPIHPDELLRVIRGALLRSTLRRENAELITRLREANINLEASISERTRDLAGLAAMAEAIAGVQGLDDVLQAVVQTVAQVTNASGVGAFLADESTASLDQRARWPSDAVLPMSLAAAGVPADESVVYVPLVLGGQRMGALQLRSPERANPSLLQTLAVEAAVALQNAQRFARERETVERLEEVSRMKSTFLASVSHELRTPLTAVVGFAQTLGAYGDQLEPADRKHMLDRIVVQGERLRRLINNLLDSTALETGTLRVSAGAVGVVDVVKRVVDALGSPGAGPPGGESSPAVVLDIPDGLPPAWSDEGRLEQVIANLLDNAVKHSPPDRPIVVRAVPTNGRLEIQVIDQGPGIDPAFMPVLFNAFTQADPSDTRRLGGIGLGLYIARGLVEAMGGTMSVSSTVGEGCCFSVGLPLAPL